MNTLKKQLALSLLATMTICNGIFAMNNNNNDNYQTPESWVRQAKEDTNKGNNDSAIKKMLIAIGIRQKILYTQNSLDSSKPYHYKQYLNNICMLGNLYERTNQLDKAKRCYEMGTYKHKHFFNAVKLVYLSKKCKLNISDQDFNAFHEIIYSSQNKNARELCKKNIPEQWGFVSKAIKKAQKAGLSTKTPTLTASFFSTHNSLNPLASTNNNSSASSSIFSNNAPHTQCLTNSNITKNNWGNNELNSPSSNQNPLTLLAEVSMLNSKKSIHNNNDNEKKCHIPQKNESSDKTPVTQNEWQKQRNKINYKLKINGTGIKDLKNIYKKMLKRAQTHGQTRYIYAITFHLGRIYLKQNKLNKATICFERSLNPPGNKLTAFKLHAQNYLQQILQTQPINNNASSTSSNANVQSNNAKISYKKARCNNNNSSNHSSQNELDILDNITNTHNQNSNYSPVKNAIPCPSKDIKRKTTSLSKNSTTFSNEERDAKKQKVSKKMLQKENSGHSTTAISNNNNNNMSSSSSLNNHNMSNKPNISHSTNTDALKKDIALKQLTYKFQCLSCHFYANRTQRFNPHKKSKKHSKLGEESIVKILENPHIKTKWHCPLNDCTDVFGRKDHILKHIRKRHHMDSNPYRTTIPYTLECSQCEIEADYESFITHCKCYKQLAQNNANYTQLTNSQICNENQTTTTSKISGPPVLVEIPNFNDIQTSNHSQNSNAPLNLLATVATTYLSDNEESHSTTRIKK